MLPAKVMQGGSHAPKVLPVTMCALLQLSTLWSPEEMMYEAVHYSVSEQVSVWCSGICGSGGQKIAVRLERRSSTIP